MSKTQSYFILLIYIFYQIKQIIFEYQYYLQLTFSQCLSQINNFIINILQMPPKKKAKGDDGEREQEEKVMVLEHKCRALQTRFVEEQERADRAKAAENEIRGRVIELENDLKKEKDKLFCIVSDMTRQYKQMQDELLKEVSELRQLAMDKDEIIKNKEQYINDMIKDYEYRLKKKDDEINDLKRKIEEMSAEFARMLKDTLDKMQERIHFAQWDNDTDPQIMKKLKEMAGINDKE
ncbi:hypothetical protein pb186bvf_001329 [Paramecium bursaria]